MNLMCNKIILAMFILLLPLLHIYIGLDRGFDSSVNLRVRHCLKVSTEMFIVLKNTLPTKIKRCINVSSVLVLHKTKENNGLYVVKLNGTNLSKQNMIRTNQKATCKC